MPLKCHYASWQDWNRTQNKLIDSINFKLNIFVWEFRNWGIFFFRMHVVTFYKNYGARLQKLQLNYSCSSMCVCIKFFEGVFLLISFFYIFLGMATDAIIMDWIDFISFQDYSCHIVTKKVGKMKEE